MNSPLPDRFEVVRPLGSGGMSDVFLVRERESGALRALKQLRTRGPEAEALIRDEFARLARIRHANLVQVFDLGTLPDESPFFTMEFLEGHSLDEAVPPGDVAGAVRAMGDVLAGLSALHAAGLVHCDLHASNLRVVRDAAGVPTTRILDLGLSGRVNDAAGDRVRGRAGYVAPEVLAKAPYSRESDFYALGATLYRVLTGRPAFPGRDPAEILAVQRKGAPALLPLRTSNVPPGLQTLILQMLATEPGGRAGAASELGELAARRAPGAGVRAHDVRGGFGPLEGRDDVLAALRRHLLGAHPLRAAALFGPYGSGRTRLARELAIEAELAGWNVLWFDSSRPPTGPSIAPGRTLLVADDVDAWPENASHALGSLAAGLDGALLFVQGRRPAEGDPVYRVLLALDEPPAPAPFALGPLNPAAAERFAVQRLGGPIAPEELQHLIAPVGLLPGAILGELDRWITAGALYREGDRWRTREIPPAATSPGEAEPDEGGALAARLSPSARTAAFIVACWPPADEIAELARASGIAEAELAAACEELAWAGTLQVDRERRRVVPEVLARHLRGDRERPELQAMRRGLRDALAARVAHAEIAADLSPLARSWCLLALASHDLALGEVEVGRQLLLECTESALATDRELALEATDKLLGSGSVGDLSCAIAIATNSRLWARLGHTHRAEALLAAASSFLPSSENARTAQWSVERADLLISMNQFSAAIRLLDPVIQDSSPLDATEALLGKALSLRGWCKTRLEQHADGFDDLRGALRLIPGDAGEDRTVALMRLGISLYLAGERDEGIRLTDKALELAEGLSNADLEARVRGNVALRFRIEGDLDRSDAECRKGLAAIGKTGTTRQHFFLTVGLLGSAYDRRDWGACADAEFALERISKESGDPAAMSRSLHSKSLVALLRGDLPGAIAALRRERPWIETTELLEQRLFWVANSGVASSWLGDERLAEKRLRWAYQRAKRAVVKTAQAFAARNLAEIARIDGRSTLARRLYRIAVSLRERDPATLLTAGLGLARIALADRNLAAIRDARMVFTPLDGNKSLPDLALAHAEISAYESLLDGHVEEAKQAIGTVVAGLRTLALAPREIQAAWAMGRALQAVDPHAADLLLMEAHDLSRRCGMWGYSRRIAEDRLASRPGVPILARSGSGEGEFLSRAIELLNSLQEFPVLLQRSLDLAGETVGADRGFILLHEEGDSGLRVMAAFGDVDESARTSAHEVSRTIVKRVTRTGESFLTEDAGEDPRLGSTQSLLDLPVRSLLCVPLRIRERVVGTIYLESRAHTAQFSVDDRDLLESFAHLVAVAIENGRLHDELKRSRERVIRENLSLRQDVSKKFARPNIIAQSAQMERVLDEAERVAMSRISVHIAGATGTGKELIAKHIHYASPRADQPFIAVNCGAINKDLMESELFGIVSGAASNVTEHKGFFERANGGTLFLDEIGDMPVDVQIKLLRVLEEREFTPVRGTRVVRTDFRVISATNQDLRQLMRDGQFRSDLFFRIRGHEIRLPSLRERPVDIPLLAQHFLQKFCEENGLPVPRISPRFIDVILHHAWPGNVRDLRNYVESCRFQSRGPLLEPVIQPEEVMDPLESVTAMHPGNDPPSQAPAGRSNSELRSDVREFERAVLVRGLDQANWIQRRAAERLGLSESTLRAKIRTHGIKSPPGQEPKRGRPSREQRESES